jgi:hypothetical protein
MVLVHCPRTNNVLAIYWVSTSPLAPSDIRSPWVMERTPDHLSMGHGAYDRLLLHGSWSVQQTICPWVMGRTPDHLSMGHGAYARRFPHGSWSVRQTISPWVMECTTDHFSMGHGAYDGIYNIHSSWVMERTPDHPAVVSTFCVKYVIMVTTSDTYTVGIICVKKLRQ